MTVTGAIHGLFTRPVEMLVKQWNWKSALFSSTLRALLFLFANLAAGWRAATGAMLAEFLYRGSSAGFYGAITQALREAEPAWKANAAAMIALPLISHSIELAIHLSRGTPRIVTSVIASLCFTALSTLFNLYAMRRGALVVGAGSDTVRGDLKRIPRLIWGFLCAGPIAVKNAMTPVLHSHTSPAGKSLCENPSRERAPSLSRLNARGGATVTERALTLSLRHPTRRVLKDSENPAL